MCYTLLHTFLFSLSLVPSLNPTILSLSLSLFFSLSLSLTLGNTKIIHILAFFSHSPKSDTCKVCDSMKIAIEAESNPTKKESLKLEWELHKVKADRGYQSFKEDTAFAKLHSDTEMLTFDLEKSLPTPVLTTGIVATVDIQPGNPQHSN